MSSSIVVAGCGCGSSCMCHDSASESCTTCGRVDEDGAWAATEDGGCAAARSLSSFEVASLTTFLSRASSFAPASLLAEQRVSTAETVLATCLRPTTAISALASAATMMS